MTLQQTIANNVRAMRKVRNMRQVDVAGLTDLPRTYISHIEKGEVNITLETIERLAAAFKVNPLTLMVEDAVRGPF